jgi:hypothetical protein
MAQGGAVEAQRIELRRARVQLAREVGSVMLIGASGQQVGVHGYHLVNIHKAGCEHQ